jgi:uncharacterized cupredoxin-like copper-binding protein
MKKKGMMMLAIVLTATLSAAAGADDLKPQEIRIEASEYQFTPSRVSLKELHPVVLTLVNTGKFTHEFESQLFYGGEARVEVDGVAVLADEIGEIELKPGKSATIRFVPRKKGAIEFMCNAEDPTDHFKKGMKGTIKIE